MKKLLVLCILILAVPAFSAHLAWDNPTQNTDGSPLTDLTYTGVYRNGVNISSVPAPANSIDLQAAKGDVFTLKAIDSLGGESVASTPAVYRVNPKAPRNGRVK